MIPTKKVRGVGPALSAALAEHGFRSIKDLANASPGVLLEVRGVGAASAPGLIAAAKQALLGEEHKGRPAAKPARKPGPTRSFGGAAQREETVAGAVQASNESGPEAKAEKKKAKAKAAKRATKAAKKAAEVNGKKKSAASAKAVSKAAKTKAAKKKAKAAKEAKTAEKKGRTKKRKKPKKGK